MTIIELQGLLKSIDENLHITTSKDGLKSIDYDDNGTNLTIYTFEDEHYYLTGFEDYLTNFKVNRLIHLIDRINSTEVNNQFSKFTDHLAKVLQDKNQAYGDSFSKSIDVYGMPAIGIRLSDKYNRIEHLITNNELQENDESLEDTLLDNAGYSILALKYLEEHKNNEE